MWHKTGIIFIASDVDVDALKFVSKYCRANKFLFVGLMMNHSPPSLFNEKIKSFRDESFCQSMVIVHCGAPCVPIDTLNKYKVMASEIFPTPDTVGEILFSEEDFEKNMQVYT